VAKNRVELTHSVDDAFKYATKVLVEHAITNLREINCSVLGDENDAIASECEEPLHTKDILSYEDKYVSNAKGSGSKGMASVSRRIPAELSPEKREEVRELAVRSFKALGCNGVSRIDFMIDEDNGKLYFPASEEKERRVASGCPQIRYFSMKKEWKDPRKALEYLDTISKNGYNNSVD
jgi:D-alanine-D-alanine ligase